MCRQHQSRSVWRSCGRAVDVARRSIPHGVISREQIRGRAVGRGVRAVVDLTIGSAREKEVGGVVVLAVTNQRL